ncbi:MAG: tetratricopeptide repeat protein [Gammaproteobacteria bacterium]|nr:tetratricopeptide repeat protein [Gammaproteobacteria bacterium]MBT8135237.1 tetratricopeptide repeat protein [Gammaproteobacteria bacterium]NNJ51533.1 tetratricopeptide repeat protein [Gammaproteobacteria bacterium]
MVLKYLPVLIISLTLLSCAGGDVKQGEAVSYEKKTKRYLDIDSDVEDDFKSAIVLMQQDQNAQAVSVLKSVIEREKRLPAPYVNIAIAYNKLGDTKAAEENLISALKLDIAHPVANNELGLLYRKSGKFKAARTAYENAIKEHPEYLPAIRNLGILCDLYIHDYTCALQQYEEYLQLEPDDKTVSIWIADVKRRLAK